ncbi:hypothetical protein [Flavobacterium sp.]|uniref:hypothetical protein n=1 Tax=Flavobacterium sp. TaxID=239 RepID=UPI0026290A12|nr:hypothetical protein [Flavobacterium sp.]MDD2985460.1 hypothetical protein [Flavobacterium sp.]
MKKLFLFLAASTLALTSCSSDDDSAPSIGGTINVTIDGQAKTFNTVVVNEEVFDAGTVDEYTELTVTGVIGTNTNEIITFIVDKGDLGANAIYSFNYTKDGAFYYNTTISTNVTTNNDSKKLIGNFSGTMTSFSGTGEGVELVFTNGTFNIQY